MAEPNEYLAIVNLQAALVAMCVADGYHFSVKASAVSLDPNAKVEDFILPDGPRPFVLLEVKPEGWQYFPADQIKLRMAVSIHWVSESNVTDDASRLKTYFRGVADIERAIAIDPGRGSHVVDTRIVRRRMDHELSNGSQVWAVVDVEMPLHRTYGQPDV